MQNTRWIYSSLIALALVGCGASDKHEADVRILKETEVLWTREFAARNVDKLTDHYTENAILMAPGMPASSGKPAIRKVLADMVADQALSLQFQAARVEVAKARDMAYTQGTYQLTMTDPVSKHVIHDHGSYVTTYAKQEDGSWKAVADIATSEVAPAAPPTPTSASIK
jgi:ketosteroid isomerase-like protein